MSDDYPLLKLGDPVHADGQQFDLDTARISAGEPVSGVICERRCQCRRVPIPPAQMTSDTPELPAWAKEEAFRRSKPGAMFAETDLLKKGIPLMMKESAEE